MTTLTHTIFGIVLAKVSMDTGLLPLSPHIVYPLSIGAANLPDIDVFFVAYPKNHRKSVLHTPFYYLLCFSILFSIAYRIAPYMLPYLILTTTGVISHFLFDTFDMSTGIAWFSPFNKTFFNALPRVFRPLDSKRDFILSYLKHPVMIAEGVVTALSIIAFLKW